MTCDLVGAATQSACGSCSLAFAPIDNLGDLE
jgi:hypothetical protein